MVDRVSTHKYLGVIFDSKVSWSEYDSYIIKKANARLCCFRKLRSFGVSASVVAIFYNAAVCSAITIVIVCWGGNISKHEKGRLDITVKKGDQVVGISGQSIE